MRRSIIGGCLLLVGVVLAFPASAVADDAIYLLGDEHISVEDAAGLSCHDLKHPVVRCFEDADAMEADISQLLRDDEHVAAAVLLSGYVIVYEHASYRGANRMLSIDYSNLNSIGWNDRISSFKSFSATGAFYEHGPPGGFIYSYGTSTTAPNLPSPYNDAFSSFDIN